MNNSPGTAIRDYILAVCAAIPALLIFWQVFTWYIPRTLETHSDLGIALSKEFMTILAIGRAGHAYVSCIIALIIVVIVFLELKVPLAKRTQVRQGILCALCFLIMTFSMYAAYVVIKAYDRANTEVYRQWLAEEVEKRYAEGDE